MREAVLELLAPARRVLVAAHLGPDGDALGATLGMSHLLEGQGKEVHPFSAGPIPPEYRWLPGCDRISEAAPAPGWADAAVLLDCHEPRRAGEVMEKWLPAGPPCAVIDHHEGARDFGAAIWVDPSQAATCAMVFQLARAASWEVTPQAAINLYVGLLTDTGSFRYANTTPQVLRDAADLVAAGADPWQAAQEVYPTNPVRVRILARIIKAMELRCGGRLALGRVRLRDLDELGAKQEDLDQAVEALRGVPGVQAAILVKEQSGGRVKLSLRGRGGVDLARVAIGLGGGGHKNAAGVTLEADPDAAAEQVAGLVAQAMGCA